MQKSPFFLKWLSPGFLSDHAYIYMLPFYLTLYDDFSNGVSFIGPTPLYRLFLSVLTDIGQICHQGLSNCKVIYSARIGTNTSSIHSSCVSGIERAIKPLNEYMYD